MAVCNEKYRLFLIDIGAYGHEGEKQVYSTFEISKSLEDGSMDLPAQHNYHSFLLKHLWWNHTLVGV